MCRGATEKEKNNLDCQRASEKFFFVPLGGGGKGCCVGSTTMLRGQRHLNPGGFLAAV